MRLRQVALGSPLQATEQRLEEDVINQQIAARGQGGPHDSIVGLSLQDGGALNHEETVVYDEAAAIPSYLIVYKL